MKIEGDPKEIIQFVDAIRDPLIAQIRHLQDLHADRIAELQRGFNEVAEENQQFCRKIEELSNAKTTRTVESR
jgi:hypothetical protein